MLKQKLTKILTLNGVSIIIGIVGGVFGLFSIFVTDWSYPISLKWFVFVAFLFFSIILFFSTLISELLKEVRVKQSSRAKAVRFIMEDNIILIEKNIFLGQSATVTIFYLDEDYEVVIGTGYIFNIQEKFVTVEILGIEDEFITRYKSVINQMYNNDYRAVQKIFVKGYLIYKN